MALAPVSNQPSNLPGDPDVDQDKTTPDSDRSSGRMSFLEHLDELRKRIINATIALFGGFLIAFVFIGPVFDFIMRPLQEALPEGGTLIYTNPTEAFILNIKIAAIAGLVIASPLVIFQVWRFIAPGLYVNEKKWAIPFVVISTACFVAGTAFSHYIVFPFAWTFFAAFTTDILTFMPRIEPAFSMYIRLLLAFGVVFEMPTMVLFLSRMGLLTARFMVKNFKYFMLIAVVLSAVITPPDVISQIAMTGPLIILYGISIGLAWAFGKREKRIRPYGE
jgi:sec-independent protein translocase protein TatC